MIADSGSVDTHKVHKSYLHFTLEHRKIGRALKEVA